MARPIATRQAAGCDEAGERGVVPHAGPGGRHNRMEALRDGARRLRSSDLAGCVLVSASRACRMGEAAAGRAGISRRVYGESIIDAGAPR